MVQPKTDASAAKVRSEPNKAETVSQNVRLRDPRLARQSQFQNPTQRNFNQRNRAAPPVIQQRFGPASVLYASNSQSDNPVLNRPTAAFNATNMDDSGRKSRTTSKNRGSPKDMKNRSASKTSPQKSQKSSSQKSSPKLPSTKSSSKSSKTSPSSNNRSSPKDSKRDRYKEKESNKLSPSRSSAISALAEAEKKIKEFTIPFKKRSPSPKDKSAKSITDPKVSSTTKSAADSPTKFKGNKTNSKSRNYVRHNRDESISPIPNKDNVEIGQQKTSPSTSTISSTTTSTSATTTSTTTTASELIGSTLITSAAVEPVANVPANVNSVPLTGITGENQNFKSKDQTFVVKMVKISHVVHSCLLTRLMMMISIGLIIDCINRRDNFLNKLIVIGTGDNFFIKTFCRFFFQFNFHVLFFQTIS